MSPFAVVLPSKPGPYQDASPSKVTPVELKKLGIPLLGPVPTSRSGECVPQVVFGGVSGTSGSLRYGGLVVAAHERLAPPPELLDVLVQAGKHLVSFGDLDLDVLGEGGARPPLQSARSCDRRAVPERLGLGLGRQEIVDHLVVDLRPPRSSPGRSFRFRSACGPRGTSLSRRRIRPCRARPLAPRSVRRRRRRPRRPRPSRTRWRRSRRWPRRTCRPISFFSSARVSSCSPRP